MQLGPGTQRKLYNALQWSTTTAPESNGPLMSAVSRTMHSGKWGHVPLRHAWSHPQSVALPQGCGPLRSCVHYKEAVEQPQCSGATRSPQPPIFIE